jgi:hypothetical protein
MPALWLQKEQSIVTSDKGFRTGGNILTLQDTYIHTHIPIHTFTHMHTYIHTYLHTDTYTYTHKHTYIHTYTHTYIHIWARTIWRAFLKIVYTDPTSIRLWKQKQSGIEPDVEASLANRTYRDNVVYASNKRTKQQTDRQMDRFRV